MRQKLSALKLKVYCFVVNKNVYVKEAYQLPIELDEEYHRRHRIQEWCRLIWLLFKYRILHMKPSEEEMTSWKEQREKKESLQSVTGVEQQDDAAELRQSVSKAIDEFKGADLIRFSERGNIAIWGNGSGSGIPLFVKSVMESSEKFEQRYHFIWLRNKKKREQVSTITTFYYPWLLMEESGYSKKNCLFLTDKEMSEVSRYDFLQQAANEILQEHPQMDVMYAKLISHGIYRYFSAALEYFRPRLVLVWDESSWVSLISKICCEENGTPYTIVGWDCFHLAYYFSNVKFSKTEMLTLAFTDKGGELTQKERMNAIRIIEHLNANKNKKQDSFSRILSRLDFSRPLVFFCGQIGNGKEKWLCEDGKQGKRISLFSSTYEEILYLSEICRRNRWNLIYHSLSDKDVCETEGGNLLPRDVIDITEYAADAFVERCDVLINPNRELTYWALVNKKPIVLMEYSDVFEQECCYEVHSKERIADIICTAIEQGMTDYQYEQFLKGFVFLQKKYYFSADKDDIYGQSIEKMIAYLESLINGTLLS